MPGTRPIDAGNGVMRLPGKSIACSALRSFPVASAIIVVLLVLIGAGECPANRPVILTQDREVYLLGPDVDILTVTDAHVNMEDVSSPPLSDRFVPSRQKVPNFAFATGAHWLRFNLVNESSEHRSWVFEVQAPTVDHVDLYFDSGRGEFVRRSSGDAIPFDKWPIRYVFPAFHLHIPPGKKVICYVRLESTGLIRVPLFLWTEKAFHRHARREQALSGLFFGAVAIIILYSLFFWASFRDSTSLYYVLPTGTFGIAIAIFSGWAYQYLWPSWPRWNTFALMAISGLMEFSLMGFVRHFLKSERYAPCLDKVARATMCGALLVCALTFVAYRLAIMLALAIMATVAVLSLILSVKAYLKGYRPALGFLIAYLVLLIGMTVWTMGIVGVTPYAGIPSYPLRIGIVATLLLLSGVLARRYRRLMREYTQSLESEVSERTRALNTALTDLRRSRDELALRVQERTAAEAQARKTLIIQNAILDNIPDMAWLKDREGKFLAVNEAFEKTSRLSRQELVGKTDLDFWPRDVALRFQADDEEVMRSCRRKHIQETLVRETAEPTWIETIKSPICDEGGTAMGTTGISRNVTEYVKDITEATVARQRIEAELSIAGEIQRNILPADVPEFALRGGTQLCAKCKPAQEVAGDLYDYFLVGDHRLNVVVGDVSGKGLAAALFMALTAAMIRITAKRGLRPDEVLQTVNAELAQGNTMCMFATLFLGDLDLHSGEFVYSNAGHLPPYLLPAGGGCQELSIPRGRPVGIRATSRYHLEHTTLAPGDGLFVYTDGITEAVDLDGNFLGENRLLEILSRMNAGSARDTVDRVLEQLASFSGGAAQADDISALCLRFQGPVERPSCVAITLTTDLAQIHAAREAFERFAGHHALSENIVADMQLALEEVVVNVMTHAGDTGSGKIEVLFQLEGTVLTVIVTDDCREFNPLEAEPFPQERRRKEKKIGGWGLHLVKNLTDSMEYRREDNRNILILKKKVERKEPTA